MVIVTSKSFTLVGVTAALSLLTISEEVAARSTMPPSPASKEINGTDSILRDESNNDYIEYENCTFNTRDLDLVSGADGTLPDLCDPGYRRITDERPCFGLALLNCCMCDAGFFHSEMNNCDSCIQHRQCDEYEFRGNFTSDAVCKTPPVTEEPPGLPSMEPSTMKNNQSFVTPAVGTTDEPDQQSCPSTPCVNNGSCVIDGYSNTRCLCMSGWTGIFCEEDINECMSPQACKNNGSCSNFGGGYGCNCTAGWEGTYCEVRAADISSAPSLVWVIVGLCAVILVFFLLLVVACICIERLRHERVYHVVPSDLEQYQMQNTVRGKNETED